MAGTAANRQRQTKRHPLSLIFISWQYYSPVLLDPFQKATNDPQES
jgi:hypothetical protein